jgi:TPR repeat protein
MLAIMYCEGEGVLKGYKRATEWCKKAAMQGYAEAQNRLAIMYIRGEGVPKDTKKAAEWYGKAVEQGHAEAQCNLAHMYFYGQGVPKDTKKASPQPPTPTTASRNGECESTTLAHGLANCWLACVGAIVCPRAARQSQEVIK